MLCTKVTVASMTCSDAERLFEGEHLGQACHQEQSDDRGELVWSDAVGLQGRR